MNHFALNLKPVEHCKLTIFSPHFPVYTPAHPPQNPRISNFSKESASFHWRMELENKIWVTERWLQTGCHCFYVLSVDVARKYMCIHQLLYVNKCL